MDKIPASPGIYCIKNQETGKIYIGSSFNMRKRQKQHFAMLEKKHHENKELQKDYDAGYTLLFSVVKELPKNNHNLLMREEADTIELYKKTGVELYNIALLRPTSHFISKQSLKDEMANKFCVDRFGITFDALTSNANEAKIQMFHEIINADPEDEQNIRDDYAEVIAYLNEEKFKYTSFSKT